MERSEAVLAGIHVACMLIILYLAVRFTRDGVEVS